MKEGKKVDLDTNVISELESENAATTALTTTVQNNIDDDNHNGNTPVNADSDSTTTTPTVMDIVYDLNGSLGFVIGSSGFIFAMYYTNWLPFFRFGSLFWIYGCVFYLIPLILKLKIRAVCSKDSTTTTTTTHFTGHVDCTHNESGCCPWSIGEVGELMCNVFWLIGCVLGGFFKDEATVESFLPTINHTFAYGSFSLAVEPVYQLFLFGKKKGSFRSRLRTMKLFGGSSSSSSSSSSFIGIDTTVDVSDEENALTLNLDRCFELGAMIFFCAAAIFGGFPPHPSLALPGVYCWIVGSFFGLARSFLLMYERFQKLQKNDETTTTQKGNNNNNNTTSRTSTSTSRTVSFYG
eukprot:CAMPEP_0170967454 /NCGR_PEP_ID=MMETSP0735-20130129/42592_1 /TAXON_ID=186038 /ORGANISM="Fragilariopsis kerguelensis, Strain L26-C5" /LENGTH=350 /DNA_ID=CAMNT_0011386135 /DNA_START=59 /DNA_END=1111 /DNA_ORIENTATION=-